MIRGYRECRDPLKRIYGALLKGIMRIGQRLVVSFRPSNPCTAGLESTSLAGA